MRLILALAGALLLASPAAADPGDRDTGGNIFARATTIWWHDLRNRPKRIGGYCASACTMWLGYERTCFEPGTVLGFHSASIRGFGRTEELNRVLEAHYPPRTRAWFRAGPAHSTRVVRVPVERFVEWGEARLCD